MVDILHPKVPTGGIKGIAKEGVSGVAGVVFVCAVVGIGYGLYKYASAKAKQYLPGTVAAATSWSVDRFGAPVLGAQ